MCLIALSVEKASDWNGKDSYFFKVIANRDEYHARQTTQMHWWSNKLILAGKDEEAGGTWLGTNRNGKFAAITNLKEQSQINYKSSRGALVTDFLESKQSAKFRHSFSHVCIFYFQDVTCNICFAIAFQNCKFS